MCLSAVCIVTIKHTARQTQISNEWQGMRERVVAGNASAAKRTGIMNRWPPQLWRNGQKPCCVWLCELCSAGCAARAPCCVFPQAFSPQACPLINCWSKAAASLDVPKAGWPRLSASTCTAGRRRWEGWRRGGWEGAVWQNCNTIGSLRCPVAGPRSADSVPPGSLTQHTLRRPSPKAAVIR